MAHRGLIARVIFLAKMAIRKIGKIGASFDGFLAEQGILQECEEQAIMQILADQIKAAMAVRMNTSRRRRSAAPFGVDLI